MYFSLFIYSFTTYLSALLYIHLHIYYNLAGVSQNKNAWLLGVALNDCALQKKNFGKALDD